MDWQAYTATGILDAGPDHAYIDDGAIKPTFRIDTDSESYILQTVETGSEGRLHKQRELYESLTDSEVPVPNVVHDASDGAVPYQVLMHIDGDDPHYAHHDMDVDEVLELTGEAGRYLGEAHEELSMDGYGWLRGTPDGLAVEDDQDWRSFYADFISRHIDRIEGGPLDRGDIVERARTVLDETIEDVPDDPGGAVCHRDYRPGNILADGARITAVLDWDNAFSGDPRYDLARSQQSFGGAFNESAPEGTVQHRFREAYEDARGKVDDDLHEIYSLGARLDHGSAATWLIENGYELPDAFLDAQHEAIGYAVGGLERD